jgi:hypothetical protein
LLANEFARSRQALLDFQPLLREDHRRMSKPAIFEARRPGKTMLGAIAAALVVFGDKLPGEVAGAHPQVEHDRRMACLRHFKAFFHHFHDGRQIGSRIEQPNRRLHGIGV